MQSFLIDMGFQLLSHSWQLFALVAGVVMVGGMCLGMAKRTFVKLVDGGDFLAARFMEKPRAIAVIGVIAGLTVPSFVMGLGMAPTKIVTKEVPVPVTDNEMIDRLQGELAAEQMKVGVAKAKAERLEEERGAMEVRVAQTQAQMESVKKEMDQIRPRDSAVDVERVNELCRSMDKNHAEYARREGQHTSNYQKYRQVEHVIGQRPFASMLSFPDLTKPGYTPTLYHRGCGICDENCKAREEIDAIWNRHPVWRKKGAMKGE